jgi:hypothetical protein
MLLGTEIKRAASMINEQRNDSIEMDRKINGMKE